MSFFLGVLVDAVVKHADIVRIDEATVFRSPSGPMPSQAILQHSLEDKPSDFTMSHEPFLVLVKIRLFMDFKIVYLQVLIAIFLK